MAIRLQDSEEWNSHFVRNLPGPYRCFWFWLKSACNHAGVWEIDIDLARMRTGSYEIEKEKAQELFKDKILVLKCGEKWFILNFCYEQYKANMLNPANTAHRGAIRILEQLNLIDENFNILNIQTETKVKALTSPFIGAKDKDLDLNTAKVLDQDKKQQPKKKLASKVDFEIFWSDYDKKVGKKEKIQSKWDALKMSEQEAILEHIPVYKNQQPDKWFRKDPETYLNNRSWLDEVLIKPENIKSDIVPLNKAHAVLSISNNAKFKGE